MPVIEITQSIDARGLSCPLPIVKTAQAMKALGSGATVELIATDHGSIKDVAAWCQATGNTLLEQTSDGAVYRFLIRRK
jgi:tRNA 2-thiouridine synthesizing protein A